jgi:uncharacterized ferritin-like protein (DUF455 family)
MTEATTEASIKAVTEATTEAMTEAKTEATTEAATEAMAAASFNTQKLRTKTRDSSSKGTPAKPTVFSTPTQPPLKVPAQTLFKMRVQL